MSSKGAKVKPGALSLQHSMPLVRLDSLEQALLEAKTVPALKTLHDELTAVQALAKRMRLSLIEQNRIAEYRIHVARKAGGILASTVRRGGDAMAGSSAPLPEGITWSQSSRWQKLHRLDEELLAKYLQATAEHQEEVTVAGLMRASENGIQFRSDSEEWCTQKEVIDAIIATLGRIGVDPCSNDARRPNVPAKAHFTRAHDGLAHPWHGKVLMSPPYGAQLPRWTSKLLDEFEAGRTKKAIALVPSRTYTEWFRSLREYPRCFIQGRLRFNEHRNGAPFPSMAVYLGSRPGRFARSFAAMGDLYILYRL